MAWEFHYKDRFAKVFDRNRNVELSQVADYGPDGMHFDLRIHHNTITFVVNRDVRNEKTAWVVNSVIYPDDLVCDRNAIRDLILESLNAYRVLGYKHSHDKIEVFMDVE